MLLDFPILSLLLLFPLLAAVATYVVGRATNNDRAAKWTGIGLSLFPLALSTLLVLGFVTDFSWFSFNERTVTGPANRAWTYQAWESVEWIPDLNVTYLLGVDGLSVFLVFLTTLLTPLALAVSWGEHHRAKEFFALFLFMETTILGVFLSLDFFLFFLFWEAGLVPMYFLIAVWGGPRKRYAAIKFFLFTQAASLLVLLGIFALYFYGGNTFDMTQLIAIGGGIPVGVIQNFVFIAFLIGFGTKLPTFPLHTWLPDAHVEAPTGGSVMLAGILLKLGGYGLFRVNVQMLPDAAVELAWLVAALGIVSILYGAIVCIAQEDLKRLVAYSSVSHMGFVTLGVAIGVWGAHSQGADAPGILTGYSGGVFQLFAHGLISAALFMVAGSLGHNLGTRNVSELGGIAKRTPQLTMFLMIAFLASLGLPGLVGFIAELTVFIGTYAVFGWWVAIPMLSVVLTAAYYLWAAQRAMFGPLNPRWKDAHDAHAYDLVPLAVLTALFALFGLFGYAFFSVIQDWGRASLGVFG